MRAFVYKSLRKPGTYLYLDRGDLPQLASTPDDSGEADLPARVPALLLQQLQPLQLVMELELRPERRLARADAAQVMEQLSTRGYFLQMPPSLADA